MTGNSSLKRNLTDADVQKIVELGGIALTDHQSKSLTEAVAYSGEQIKDATAALKKDISEFSASTNKNFETIEKNTKVFRSDLEESFTQNSNTYDWATAAFAFAAFDLVMLGIMAYFVFQR